MDKARYDDEGNLYIQRIGNRWVIQFCPFRTGAEFCAIDCPLHQQDLGASSSVSTYILLRCGSGQTCYLLEKGKRPDEP